jgi:hypothetical protein
MLCAIHQPNFFPWMGYFNKIYRADRFIYLDNVDYEKSGHSMQCYTNRVSIVSNGKSVYIYTPLIREHGEQIINNVKINCGTEWKKDIINSITLAYNNSPYWTEIITHINQMMLKQFDFISEQNIYFINYILNLLNIDTPVCSSSEFETQSTSTERLIELTKWVECDEYMCGGGGDKYQEEDLFDNSGIILVHQNFKEPVHKQFSSDSFIKGQSILDALFNCGLRGTEELIKSVE